MDPFLPSRTYERDLPTHWLAVPAPDATDAPWMLPKGIVGLGVRCVTGGLVTVICRKGIARPMRFLPGETRPTSVTGIDFTETVASGIEVAVIEA